MLDNVLVTTVVGIISSVIGWYIAIRQQHQSRDQHIVDAHDALREDLMILITRYEAREEALQKRIDSNVELIDTLRGTINTLREEVTTLRQENAILKLELQRTRQDLEAFDTKFKRGEASYE